MHILTIHRCPDDIRKFNIFEKILSMGGDGLALCYRDSALYCQLLSIKCGDIHPAELLYCQEPDGIDNIA